MNRLDAVPIKPGRNVWLLQRTDRDAATPAEVERSALAVLSSWLTPASAMGHRTTRELAPGHFIVGSADIKVSCLQGGIARDELPGQVLRRFEDCPTVRGVVAQDPWFVVADFDWRTSPKQIPWPRRAVNAVGAPIDHDQSIDWLLIEARAGGRGSVGALERSSTLPVGDYWIDVFQRPSDFTDTRVAFRVWLAKNQSTVSVTTTEDKGDHDWVLFHVSQPTDFPQQDFGAPTIAGPDVHHSEDTVQRPPPPPPLADQAADAIQGVKSGFKTLLVVAGVGVAGFIIYKLASGSSKRIAA